MVERDSAASMRAMFRPMDSGVITRPGASAIQAAASSPALVLIEPDESVRDAIATLLRGDGWRVLEADPRRPVQDVLDEPGLVAVISESSVPGLEPAALLEACSARSLPLIFTGHELSLQHAVDLIRMGASDYLEKPFLQSRLLDLLKQLRGRQNR